MRLVLVTASTGFESWRLPPSVVSDMTWIHGGHRTIYELAVAAAGLGHDVELRGDISGRDLEEVSRWGGAAPRTGLEPRRPEEDDVVVVPEGSEDPLFHARVALSPARAIMLILAAPGLFGPDVITGSVADPLTVDPSTVGLPEHFRAMHESGFELWSNAPAIADASREAGVECSHIGTGQPVPFPPPADRTHDVSFLVNNRWAPLARRVAERLRGPVLEIPIGSREEILRALASSRVLILPAVIEGQARLQLEARAVGTIPVALRSNRFAAGLQEGGGVLVDSVEAMAQEIERLLASPGELEERSAIAAKTAAEQMDWPAFVARVGAALSAPAPPDPRRAVRARMGERIQRALTRLEELRTQTDELQRGVAWLREVQAATERERDALAEEVAWLREAGDRTARERDAAHREMERLGSRRSVRVATWFGRLFGGRPKDD